MAGSLLQKQQVRVDDFERSCKGFDSRHLVQILGYLIKWGL